MNKIIILISIIQITLSVSAFSKTGTVLFSGRHDSLIFDGTSSSYRETSEPCLMKVLLVNGNVTGNVIKKEVIKTCGEISSLITYEKRLLKEGDTIVTGEISTENDKDFIIAQLGIGENMVLGGERGLIKVKDYCVSPPNIYMTLEAGKLGIDWNPVLPKTVTVCSDNACLRIKGTVFSLEIIKEGDVVTNVLKVYEGSVTFWRNMESEANKNKSRDKGEQMKKLTEDFQQGKISIEEYTKKMQEIQSGLTESLTRDEVTVNEGFECRITGTDKPTDPVPLDANEKPWWKK